MQQTDYTLSHFTMKPGALELSPYGNRTTAHQDRFRAQEVHWSGWVQVVFWQDTAADTEIQTKTLSYFTRSSSLSYLSYNCSLPNMMEAYLWKGSNGHFPLPSSLLFSRVSVPSAKDCTDQHLRIILHTLYQFIQCGIWMKISSSEFFLTI